MRRPFAAAGLMLACLGFLPAAAVAAEPDWEGSWTGYACPKGTAPDPGRCASFFLRLHSRNAKVCGSHVFATAGAKQMDEGGTPSLIGQVEGREARGVVESLRTSPSTKLDVTLQLENGELRWQRIDNPPGDFLLPLSLTLTRSKQGSMLSALFEQRLSASCAAHLDLPAESAAPAASR